MKIGVWNIDHPEFGTRSRAKQNRYEKILHFLGVADCDIYVLSEANSAINLPGYQAQFSDESPFKNQSRSYAPPNRYHQVGIYSRLPISKIDISEPLNGVLCQVHGLNEIFNIYGNVVTIKDRWKKDSSLKYTDRLYEQISAISSLSKVKTIVAGDFNLKVGWSQKAKAHLAVEQELEHKGWVWPTKMQTHSVQHILHTPDIFVEVSEDCDVNQSSSNGLKLSDHPFLQANLSN